MRLGNRIQQRRKELGLSRSDLAKALGVTVSAVSNYEGSISFPKEPVLLKLFDALETDPNSLLRDSFKGGDEIVTDAERRMLAQYRRLTPTGREAVRDLLASLSAWQDEMESPRVSQEVRQIPLYRSPAAAGYTSPVFGEDFDYIPVRDGVPQAAEYAVRIRGDSMEPWILDGAVVYVNRDPLRPGDVGIFCVDGEMFCKQYCRDPAGVTYLFSLNRNRADADLTLMPTGGRSLICLGRVILRTVPLPGKAL